MKSTPRSIRFRVAAINPLIPAPRSLFYLRDSKPLLDYQIVKGLWTEGNAVRKEQGHSQVHMPKAEQTISA